MSEQLRSHGEQLTENIDASVESQKNLERLNEAAEQAEKDPLQKHVESLAKAAEQQAISGKEVNIGDKQGESSAQTFGVHKQLKTDAYKRSLKKIQSHLHAPERIASRIIHQPAVEAVSNVTAKTAARPSGFLTGSFVALLGSALFLYMARHYGYTYNYAVIFILFLGGFLVGLIIELLFKLVFRRQP